jgi:hypothetical protein
VDVPQHSTSRVPFGAGSLAEGKPSSHQSAVSEQPTSSSVGPEQTLGEVPDEGEVGVVVLLGREVGLGVLVPLDPLDPLDPLEPLEPLEPLDPLEPLARATLTVVIAGAA